MTRRGIAVAVGSLVHLVAGGLLGYSDPCAANPLAPAGALWFDALIGTTVFALIMSPTLRTVAGVLLVGIAAGLVAGFGLIDGCVAVWTWFLVPLVAVFYGRTSQRGELLVRLLGSVPLLVGPVLTFIPALGGLGVALSVVFPFLGMEIASAWRQEVIARRSGASASNEVSSVTGEDP